MTVAGVMLLFLWVLAVVWALMRLPDMFSPEKWFLMSLGLFFSALMFQQYDAIYYILWIVTLGVILTAAAVGGGQRSGRYFIRRGGARTLNLNVRPTVYLLLLALSVPGVLAQLYLVSLFGGLEGYVNILEQRVVEFRGLGFLKLLISTLPVLLAFYFVILLRDVRVKPAYWLGALLLGVVTIGIGLLSGSRGRVLSSLVLIALVVHYIRRPLAPVHVLGVTFAVMLLASILGVMRSRINLVNGQLETGLAGAGGFGESIRTTWMSYGLTPLELVFGAGGVDLRYGSTYLAALTNFIPRLIWPEKPDSGGVALTVDYADDRWYGLSYLSTGIFPEAVINFGTFGMFVGVVQLFMMVYLMMRLYRRFLLQQNRHSPLAHLAATTIYIKVLMSASNYLYGEFANLTNNILEWILIVLVLCLAIKVLVRRAIVFAENI